jgi:hypothetical protein
MRILAFHIFLLFFSSFYSQNIQELYKDLVFIDTLRLEQYQKNKTFYKDSTIEIIDSRNKMIFSNQFNGSFQNSQPSVYRNVSNIQYNQMFGNLPFISNIGLNTFNMPLINNHLLMYFNVKFDFEALIHHRIKMNKPDYAFERVANPEERKTIANELQKIKAIEKLKIPNTDSLLLKIKAIADFESWISNPKNIDRIKKEEALLKEASMGNKLPDTNYDSLQKSYASYDSAKRIYNQSISDTNVSKLRQSILQIYSNPNQNDQLEQSVKQARSMANNKKIWHQLNFNNWKFRKFDIGMSSLDHSELAIQNFMIQGVNIEMKSPLYVNVVHSFPFNQNNFLNQWTPSLQNTNVASQGIAIGNALNTPFKFKIGYFKFKEKNIGFENEKPNSSIDNQILFFNTKIDVKKWLQTHFEIAKSETNYSQSPEKNSPKLFESNQWFENIAVKTVFNFNLFNDQTQLKIAQTYYGNQFYSVANPFGFRGQQFDIELKQKIGSKMNAKSRLTLRLRDKDSILKSNNLLLNSEFRYKFNSKTNITYRSIYNKFNTSMDSSKSINTLFQNSIILNHRFKTKKTNHIITGTFQHQKNSLNAFFYQNDTVFANEFVSSLLSYQTNFKNIFLQSSLDANFDFQGKNAFHSNINLDIQFKKLSLNVGLMYSKDNSTFDQLGITYGIKTFWKNTTINFNINTRMRFDNSKAIDMFPILNYTHKFY